MSSLLGRWEQTVRHRARLAIEALTIVLALALATGVASLIQQGPLGIPDASPVYLVAVVAVAVGFGTWPAIVTAISAFLLFNALFIEPRFTLTVADPREWLNLLLFLFVAVAIGRLTALQTERANEAIRLARESQALFAISRVMATAPAMDDAIPAIVRRLSAESGMARIWVAIGPEGDEHVLADSQQGSPRPASTMVSTLARVPGDAPARWVRLHEGHAGHSHHPAARADLGLYRVKIEAEGIVLGSIWSARARAAGPPLREETRLLSLAADQLALAIRRDELRREATQAEISRQSDALKGALIDSVSHGLRTPLASIRAAAGGLMDPDVDWSPVGLRAAAQAIDLEAERLSRVVRNLLDLSRIEGGALRLEPGVFALDELVEPVVNRLEPILDGRSVVVDLASDLPPVSVDDVLFDAILTNLLENAARYAPAPAPMRVRGSRLGDDRVEVTVEDGGPGVSPAALPHLFDKFYRVDHPGEGARRGLGIGLSVVRGLVEAMGGRAEAAPSELGGLAIRVTVPVAILPPGSEPS